MNPFDTLQRRETVIDAKFKRKLKKQLFKGTVMSKKSNKQTIISALKQAPITASAAMAIILLLGVSTFALSSHNQKNDLQKTIDDNLAVPKDLSGVLSVDQIREKAAASAPAGATIRSVELENEHGTLLYKISYSDGTFRFYDAKTGDALQAKPAETSSEQPAAPGSTTISLQDARNIASARRPGQTITKIEVETEEGVRVYSVRFSDGGRVDVNAATGAVTRVVNGGTSSNSSGSSSSSGSNSDSSNSSGSSDDGTEHESTDDSSHSSNSGSGSNKSSDDKSGHN